MTGKGDDTSRVDENVDETRLCKAQMSEFRHMNENMVAMKEMLERMVLRLKEVEKGASSTSEGNKGGQNETSHVIDMTNRENFEGEEDYDDGAGMFVHRGSRRRGFGRGIGAGRVRDRMQES